MNKSISVPMISLLFFVLFLVGCVPTSQPTVTVISTNIAPTTTSTLTPTLLPTSVPNLTFFEHQIASRFTGVSGLHVFDIDGDGDLDIVGAALEKDEVAWWRNDGSSSIEWTKQTITAELPGTIYVFAADIDGDLDGDVIATAVGPGYLQGKVVLWLNEGGEPNIWTQQILVEDVNESHGVFAADLDGDGDEDILATLAKDNKIVWWENQGESEGGVKFDQHLVAEEFMQTQSVYAEDLDADGDLDILATALNGNDVAWWRNDGGSPLVWEKQIIDDNFAMAHWAHTADIDGDGKMDVVGAAYQENQLAWWKFDQNSSTWIRFPIDGRFNGGLTVFAVDMDLDDDMDVVAVSETVGEVAWWRNEGGKPVQWTKLEIRKNFWGAWPLAVADIDMDGDIDVVAGSGNAHQIMWWENRLID